MTADDKKGMQENAAHIQQLEKEKNDLLAQVADYENHLKRLQADFENYIKRVEVERSHIFELASAKFITKFLTVVDEMEQAVAKMSDAGKEELVSGVKLLLAKMHKMLEDEGVKPIEALGMPFDPYKHECILQVEAAERVADNTVVEELQKGYEMKGVVLRYSKVKIAKPKDNPQPITSESLRGG